LNAEEKIHYSRHLILEEIGFEGQEKLKSASVLVIGAGGLGCPVLQYLTAAGVGTLGIIDNDVVDTSNLQRQILYTVDDVGKSKVVTAANRLAKLNPFVSFKIYNERLDVHNVIEFFESYDIIVDGSDNFPTRYLANDASVITNKPLVFGSIFKFKGQVSVFNYENGPTYRCLFPDPPAPDTVPNCSDIGVLGVLPGIIGSLQANEVIKLITGIGEPLKGKLLSFDALNLQQQIFSFEKNESIHINQLQSNYHTFCKVSSVSVSEISASELQKNMKKYQILDVRTSQEFKLFNIGGVNIPLNQLKNRISEIQTEKPLVVCCQSGIRSTKAIQLILEHRADLQLINLKEGINSK